MTLSFAIGQGNFAVPFGTPVRRRYLNGEDGQPTTSLLPSKPEQGELKTLFKRTSFGPEGVAVAAPYRIRHDISALATNAFFFQRGRC